MCQGLFEISITHKGTTLEFTQLLVVLDTSGLIGSMMLTACQS